MEEPSPPEAPADVAALFRWANLEGFRYRDFSDERRAYRAGMRQQAAARRRDAAASAKEQAEQAAAEAEGAARQAAAQARFHAAQARLALDQQSPDVAGNEEAEKERALLQADQMSRRAAAERSDAARYAEASRTAEQMVRQEAMEMAEARSGLQLDAALPVPPRKALSSTDAHFVDLELTPAAESSRTDQRPGPPEDGSADADDDMSPVRYPLRRDTRILLPLEAEEAADSGAIDEPARVGGDDGGPAMPDGFALPDLALTRPVGTLSPQQTAAAVEQYARQRPYAASAQSPSSSEEHARPSDASKPSGPPGSATPGNPRTPARGYAPERGPEPAWIVHAARNADHNPVRSPLRETLQQSREKVAARWYALRGALDGGAPEDDASDLRIPGEAPPILVIYSVAGGVGKTSLAASLTRALAAQGERVLLVDTTERGLLPFYLGARELRPGVIRTFAPPSGSTDQPIHLVSYRRRSPGDAGKEGESIPDRVRSDAKGFSRVIVDLASSAEDLLAAFVREGADVLVPVAPDMSSVLSLPSVRRSLAAAGGASRVSPEAAFLLVQFDAAQPLQLDVREVVQQQLGDHLLPFVVRRSSAIAEALAEGMTVMDYAPGEGIAKDYMQVAAWVRTLAEPAREGLARARWRER